MLLYSKYIETDVPVSWETMLILMESEGFLSEGPLCAVFAQTCNLLCKTVFYI